ncbi:hypothetical protein Q4503_09230 [Colwellia sp. 6_MG-2023]|uniref:hypothetical protein n=1 Tax=Colwellia sp. 6_MG-2023 TaxID=3062676 RepID=UPI0026E35999|nr:hypothetical protein [Colwellia sp. 6_MG-2023]MDO6487882.1 hypothetical protein [Colwellia sp. 6_MG-2023]
MNTEEVGMVDKVSNKIANWLVPGHKKNSDNREIQVCISDEGMYLDKLSFKSNPVVRSQLIASENLLE